MSAFRQRICYCDRFAEALGHYDNSGNFEVVLKNNGSLLVEG